MGLETATAFRADGKYPYGFKTGGANIETGGDFTGTKIGVRASGTETGVHAAGSNTAGVYGEIIENGTGAYGLAVNANAIGVAGINNGSKNDKKKAKESGIGIVGATETGQGFGVVGLSVDSLVGTTPTSVPTVFIDDKDQVSFIGGSLTSTFPMNMKLSSGIGVVGMSGSGSGVLGKSTTGKGGVFSSDKRAQINLVPKLEKLPVQGQIGDLIVILAQRKLDDTNTVTTVPQIWFCGRDGDSKNPAYWAQVQVSFFVQAKP